jgi:hypothetical protein
MSYQTLSAEAIITTLRRLERRIHERFPSRGLLAVCQDLIALAEQTQQRAAAIAKPNFVLRTAVYMAIAAGIAGFSIIPFVPFATNVQIGTTELTSVFQGVEAAANIVVLMGAALFFLVSLETRLKRNRSLRELHAFRSIAHVIDMHQLTKDPSSVISAGPSTGSSPERTMSRFELTRYLDYCSEMLSLTNKLAALYAQNLPDAVIIDAVNDIERLTTNLSQKIWQKITILDAGGLEPKSPQARRTP